MKTINTDCRDAVKNAEGCLALAHLIDEQLRTPVRERGLEAGRCSICGDSLKVAWSIWARDENKSWAFSSDTTQARKCENDEFDPDKFLAFPEYYCPLVKERWCYVTDSEPFYGSGQEYWAEDWRGRKKATKFNLAWWFKGRNPVSPIDMAFALRDRRIWEAQFTMKSHSEPKSNRAPMEMMSI